MKYLLTILLIASTTFIASADSWKNPKTKRYFSENGEYMLKVVPRFVPEKYYKWVMAKPKRKSRFKPQDTTVVLCHAILYKVNGSQDTVEIWNKKLINKVAPVHALVSNDGKSIVTFDNWHSMGYGLDVFVVYNDNGELIHRYLLDNFTVFPLNDYMYSISSIWWRCGAEIVNNSSAVKICMETEDGRTGEIIYNLVTYEFNNTP